MVPHCRGTNIQIRGNTTVDLGPTNYQKTKTKIKNSKTTLIIHKNPTSYFLKESAEDQRKVAHSNKQDFQYQKMGNFNINIKKSLTGSQSSVKVDQGTQTEALMPEPPIVSNNELIPFKNYHKFFKRYQLGSRLGEGAYGKVYEGRDRLHGQEVVIKFIAKVGDPIKNRNSIIKEIVLLKMANSIPGVIKLLGQYETEGHFIIVMEKMIPKNPASPVSDLYVFNGGQEDFWEPSSPAMTLSESTAKVIFNQVVEIVLQLDQLGIVHLDLKDENTLIDHGTLDIKLIDFGAAEKTEDLGTTSYRGTSVYTAPEISRRKKYTPEGSNAWQLGSMLYMMLQARLPFDSKLDRYNGNLQFDPESPISKEAEDLIRRCFAVNPEKRITPKEIINHPFLKEISSDFKASEHTTPTKHEVGTQVGIYEFYQF